MSFNSSSVSADSYVRHACIIWLRRKPWSLSFAPLILHPMLAFKFTSKRLMTLYLIDEFWLLAFLFFILFFSLRVVNHLVQKFAVCLLINMSYSSVDFLYFGLFQNGNDNRSLSAALKDHRRCQSCSRKWRGTLSLSSDTRCSQ